MTMIHDEGAVERTDDERPEEAAPWWQTAPCAPFCDGDHKANDLAEDRACFWSRGDDQSVVLTRRDPIRDSHGNGYPSYINVSLYHRALEREPYLVTDLDGMHELEFTLAEAEQHARKILEAVRIARGEEAAR